MHVPHEIYRQREVSADERVVLDHDRVVGALLERSLQAQLVAAPGVSGRRAGVLDDDRPRQLRE